MKVLRSLFFSILFLCYFFSCPVPVLSANYATNSVGPLNTIKITDMSGSLSASGAAITVTAWDVSGNALTQSGSGTPLLLYSHGTTSITGTALAARFTGGTPLTYQFSVDSPAYIITNVKSSTDGTLNVPSGYTNGTTSFVANSIGPRNTIKITDMSGSLSASGASLTISAWDSSGNPIPESSSTTPLKLYSHGTTSIAGPDLMARFPSGTPMSYEFTVPLSQYVITNVKSSADGSINIPYSYTNGTTNFVANSIGPRNTIMITDMSGSISASGAAITISAWDANGNAITESSTAAPLRLYSHGTTTILGASLATRFAGGTPIAYSFAVNSSKYIITNTKSSMDGTINIPYVYTNGTTSYATNALSALNTIKITDLSGSLSSSGVSIIVTAWDVNGNALAQSSGAASLTLYNHATTTITGAALAERFTGGTPVTYQLAVGSSNYIVTNITSNAGGTINIPNANTYSSSLNNILAGDYFAVRYEEYPNAVAPANIPTASINVDGNASDWAGINPFITQSSNNVSQSGADISNVYLAQDSSFLYARIDIVNGPPSQSVTYQLYLQQPAGVTSSADYAVNGYYSGGSWQVNLSSGTGTFIKSYPGGYVAVGASCIELKVPLPDIGSPARLYITASTSNGSGTVYDQTDTLEARLQSVTETVRKSSRGTWTFDGNGNWSSTETFGSLASGGNQTSSDSGTYTVNSDGTVTITDTNGQVTGWNFGLQQGSKMLVAAAVNSPSNSQGIGVLFKKAGIPSLSNRTRFVVGLDRNDYRSRATFGTETYDTSGNINGSYTQNLPSGIRTNMSLSGTYTQNSDGSTSIWSQTTTGGLTIPLANVGATRDDAVFGARTKVDDLNSNMQFIGFAIDKPTVTMSTASLKGTYFVAFFFVNNYTRSVSGFGTLTSDGAGSYSGTYKISDSVNGNNLTDALSATYSVASDGTLNSTTTNPAPPSTRIGMVSADGSIVMITNIDDTFHQRILIGVKVSE